MKNESKTRGIYVTKPYLPEMEEYVKMLSGIWESGVLTNGGAYHQALEQELCTKLGVGVLSLVCNGTLALELAIQALGIKGKIITTPYSFVATTSSILQKGLEPVFVDIEDGGFNLDPELIGDALDGRVGAIMPVHVYGIPCHGKKIEEIARERGLKVIYDAAHAFGVELEGESVLNWGDASTLSFHATKVFHTFEGGAVVCRDPELRRQIELRKNFGYENWEVHCLGSNAKLSEAHAAMGLVMLRHLERIRNLRKTRFELYCARLENVPGIKTLSIPGGVKHNYSYFPILVGAEFPLSRDELFDRFTAQEIYPRKYFHPAITDLKPYREFKIISRHKVPNARRAADAVICLPLYPDLNESDVNRVCDVILQARQG